MVVVTSSASFLGGFNRVVWSGTSVCLSVFAVDVLWGYVMLCIRCSGAFCPSGALYWGCSVTLLVVTP